ADRAAGEAILVQRVVPHVGVVGGDVGGVRLDGDGGGEVGLLPAGGGFVGEGDAGQLGPGAAPERAGVRAGVARPLVEPDPGDGAVLGGSELHPQFHGAV